MHFTYNDGGRTSGAVSRGGEFAASGPVIINILIRPICRLSAIRDEVPVFARIMGPRT